MRSDPKCSELAALYEKHAEVSAEIEAFRAQCPHPPDAVNSTMECSGDKGLQRLCGRCQSVIGHASIEQYREHNAKVELWWWRKHEPEIRKRSPHLWKEPPYVLRHPDEKPKKVDKAPAAKSEPEHWSTYVLAAAIWVLLVLTIAFLGAHLRSKGWI